MEAGKNREKKENAGQRLKTLGTELELTMVRRFDTEKVIVRDGGI